MRQRIKALLLAVGFVIMDQLTKYAAAAALRQKPLIVWDGVLELTYVENTGAAWGMLAGGRWFLIAVTAVVLAVFLGMLCLGRFRHTLSRVAAALILAGGIGNLIDRAVSGYVVDFIYVKVIDFPVFNVADCCVCIGAGLLLIALLFLDKPSIGKERDEDGTKAFDRAAGASGGEAGQVSVGSLGSDAGDGAKVDGTVADDGEQPPAT